MENIQPLKLEKVKKKVIKEYLAGESLRGLGLKYDCDKQTVRKLLIRNGINIEFRSNKKRKYPLNIDYFKFIDKPKKAYFLGLMFADGFVLKDGYSSGINLQTEDRFLLEEFSKEVFGSDNPVYDIKKNRYKPQSRLIIKSKEFQNHLINKGCVYRKSNILEPPKNLRKNLIQYFILGYFDGDGCFSSRTFSIVSTKQFCIWIGEWMKENNIIKYYSIQHKKNKTYTLKIHKKEFLRNIYKIFYADSEIYLERKRKKIKEYIQ